MDVTSSSASVSVHIEQVSTRQKVDDLIAFIREANEFFQKELDLSPANLLVTNMINHLSHRLRSRYLPEEIESVLNNEYIRTNQQQLQGKLAEIEFLAELNEAYDVCYTNHSVLDTLWKLPTWNIYWALASQEMVILRQLQMVKGPIVFVGSGPMPLSAIILQQLSGMKLVCLEMNVAAYDASRFLMERLGLEDEIAVVLKDGAAFDYSDFRQVFVASLVQNKQDVLERIMETTTDPLIAIRTAEGMKQIRYKAIDEAELNAQGWEIVGRTSPDQNLVINSTVFLRRWQNT